MGHFERDAAVLHEQNKLPRKGSWQLHSFIEDIFKASKRTVALCCINRSIE